MKRYLVFAPLGANPRNPMILGAIEVPDCFEPTDEFIDQAEARGMDLFIMHGAEVLAPYLLAMGKRLMDRISADPRRKAHLN